MVDEVKMPYSRPMQSRVDSNSYKSTVILLIRGDANLGFGEAPVFEEPRYFEEFTKQAIQALVLMLNGIIKAVSYKSQGAYELDILDVVEYLRRYVGNRSVKAAIEMAMVDLWARQQQKGGLPALVEYLSASCNTVNFNSLGVNFNTNCLDYFEVLAQGTSLGLDSSSQARIVALARLSARGYRRVKIKVTNATSASEIRDLQHSLPGSDGLTPELSLDANGSFFSADSVNRILLPEISYVEDPFAEHDLKSIGQLCEKTNARIAFDQEVTSCNRLTDFINYVKFDIATLKLSRLGGLKELVNAISLCSHAAKSFYIGGMYDSPVLRRLNALLITLFDPPEISDLGPESDYFDLGVPPSVIRPSPNSLSIMGDWGITGAFIPANKHVTSSLRVI